MKTMEDSLKNFRNDMNIALKDIVPSERLKNSVLVN